MYNKEYEEREAHKIRKIAKLSKELERMQEGEMKPRHKKHLGTVWTGRY